MRTRSIGILLMVVLSYNYILHGYVVVFLHDVLGYSLGNYWYDGPPFFVSYDQHFWGAAVVSLVFADVYLLAWSFLSLGQKLLPKTQDDTLFLSGWPLLVLGAISFVIGIMPWVDAVVTYLNGGESAYLAFKSGEQLGVYGGLLKMMLSIASMCLCILSIAGIGLSEKLVIRVGRFAPVFWGLVVVGGTLFFGSMMALGDRVTLLEGGLAALALSSFHRIRGVRAMCLVLAFLIPVGAIGVLREMKDPKGASDILAGAVAELVVNGESSTVFSQYVAMASKVDPYPGGSLSYLGQILLPKFLVEDRPDEGPYEHFAAAAGLPARTGWGINLMTDCYVNYGLLAMVTGALILGLLHWAVFRYACVSVTGQFVFAGVVAAYPLSIRSGIPGLKGMAISMGLAYLLCLVSYRHTFRDQTRI
jgi:hypothetical protein